MNGRRQVRVSEERVVLASDALGDLRVRLAHTRLPPDLGSGWDLGVPTDWLRGLLEDWRGFDTEALQDRLDGLRPLRAEIDGQTLYVVYVEGRGPSPVPLLLTHGWPGSFLEYLELLPLLCDPGAHGADPADSFTVIVPSLPGYGFSGPPPPSGLTGPQVASLWHALMTEGLCHERYLAHGSDLGAGVTAWLARDHPDAVGAVHPATPGLAVPPPRTKQEDDFAAAAEAWMVEEGGYAHEHATKPATLGAALCDSPAGLARGLDRGEDHRLEQHPPGRGSCLRSRAAARHTHPYWVTGTITSSLLPYGAYRHGSDAVLPADDPSPVSTAVGIFGGECVPFPKPPRELAQGYYILTAWTEHPVGGHFPAAAEPELLARTLRNTLRQSH